MNDKPTLILIPGLLCDDALWTHQAAALADIVEVRVADITGEDSMPDLARAILQRAPERFALAGLSMGGYVAQEIIRQAPERISHLALLDTNARGDTLEQSENRKRMMGIAEAGRLDRVVTEMLPNLIHPEHLKVPAMADIFGQMAERVGKDAFLRQQNAIMHRVDGRGRLAAIACPTLILCGAQDAMTPPKVHEEMVDGIGSSATLVVVPDCGHLSPIEQSEAVTQALRAWLEA